MDCLEGMKQIPDKSINMILCDLPYGTTHCKWDVVIPFGPLWEQYNRIIDNAGGFAVLMVITAKYQEVFNFSDIKSYQIEQQ